VDIKTALLGLPVVMLILGPGPQTPSVRHFNDDRAGAQPSGFVLASMRQPSPGMWTVERTAANGYLLHAGNAAHAGGFSLAMAPHPTPADVLVSARLRLTGGSRAGGVVWNYVDVDHYSAAVLDLLRGELIWFRVVDGNKVRVEIEDDLELDGEAWHTLKVISDGSRVTVWLGGIRVLEDDRRGARSAVAVWAGVLAAGDAEAQFDDLRIEAAPDRRRR